MGVSWRFMSLTPTLIKAGALRPHTQRSNVIPIILCHLDWTEIGWKWIMVDYLGRAFSSWTCSVRGSFKPKRVTRFGVSGGRCERQPTLLLRSKQCIIKVYLYTRLFNYERENRPSSGKSWLRACLWPKVSSNVLLLVASSIIVTQHSRRH